MWEKLQQQQKSVSIKVKVSALYYSHSVWRPQHKQNYCNGVKGTCNLTAIKMVASKTGNRSATTHSLPSPSNWSMAASHSACFCQRFLPVERQFFLFTVIKYLLIWGRLIVGVFPSQTVFGDRLPPNRWPVQLPCDENWLYRDSVCCMLSNYLQSITKSKKFLLFMWPNYYSAIPVYTLRLQASSWWKWRELQ